MVLWHEGVLSRVCCEGVSPTFRRKVTGKKSYHRGVGWTLFAVEMCHDCAVHTPCTM